MKKFLLILIVLSIGCKPNSNSKLAKSIHNKALESFIQNFIKNIPRSEASKNILTLFCYKKSDTVVFNLSNSIPELGTEKYLGYSLRQDIKICCLGDTTLNSFFAIEYKEHVPEIVMEKNRAVKNSPNLVLAIIEPSTRSICFINGSEIECGRNLYLRQQ